MEKAVYAKFSQNGFLKAKLLSTVAARPQDSRKSDAEAKETESGEKEEDEGDDRDDSDAGEKKPEEARGMILVEHTGRDCLWGDGGDGSGLNTLGKILMRVRERLQREAAEGCEAHS